MFTLRTFQASGCFLRAANALKRAVAGRALSLPRFFPKLSITEPSGRDVGAKALPSLKQVLPPDFLTLQFQSAHLNLHGDNTP